MPVTKRLLTALTCLWLLPASLLALNLPDQCDALAAKADLKAYERCISLLEPAVQAEPDNFSLVWRLARAHCNYAELAAAKGADDWQTACQAHGQAALKAAQSAARLKPRSVEGHYWSAQAIAALSLSQDSVSLIKQNLLNLQRESLIKAVQLNRKYADAAPLQALALFYASAPRIMGGSPAKAEDLAREALRLSPKSPSASLTLATVLSSRDKTSNQTEIKHLLLSLIASQPGDPNYNELLSLKARKLAGQ